MTILITSCPYQYVIFSSIRHLSFLLLSIGQEWTEEEESELIHSIDSWSSSLTLPYLLFRISDRRETRRHKESIAPELIHPRSPSFPSSLQFSTIQTSEGKSGKVLVNICIIFKTVENTFSTKIPSPPMSFPNCLKFG